MDTYKETLAAIFKLEEGFPELECKAWDPLNDLITEEVLKGAYEAGKKVSYPGLELVARDCKTMERINVKKAMVRPDLGFKTNCDFMGFRVFTKDIKDIPSVVNTIVEENKKVGNPYLVRENLYGPDVVQYMYVYHADLGFLAEYQIGHPFAVLKFKHDSAIRDGKEGDFLNFKDAKVKVYKIIVDRILKGEDVKLEETWQEGFGIEPSEEWKQCF